jgi:Tol biopolymer transport system component
MRIKALAVPDLVVLLFALAVASPTLSCGHNAAASQTPLPNGGALPLNQEDPVQVYVMSADGQPQLLTTLSSVPIWAWAPDDDHAALITDPETKSPEIHIISVKAGTVIATVDVAAYVKRMAWSPNGECLAWETETSERIGVEAVRANGSDRRILGTGKSWTDYADVFAWKDDTTLLASLWEGESNDPVRGKMPAADELFEFGLANANERHVGDQPMASWAQLSRDASRVVFIGGGTPEGCSSGYASSLWVMDVSDGSLRQALPATCNVNSASWSPDGSQIAYGVGDENAGGTYVLDIASGATRKIDSPSTLFDHVWSWSSDGSTVIGYRSKCGGQGSSCGEPLPALVLIPVAGGSESIISGKGNWGDYEFSSSGRALAFNNDGLQVVQLPNGEVRQVMAADSDSQFDLLGWSADGEWFAFARSRSPGSR